MFAGVPEQPHDLCCWVWGQCSHNHHHDAQPCTMQLGMILLPMQQALLCLPVHSAMAIAPSTMMNGPKGYCWTHGIMKNGQHMSASCKNKAAGHQDTATTSNKLGGMTTVWKLCMCTPVPE